MIAAVRGGLHRLLAVGRSEWLYRGALLGMFGVAVALRLPVMAQGLPPF